MMSGGVVNRFKCFKDISQLRNGNVLFLSNLVGTYIF